MNRKLISLGAVVMAGVLLCGLYFKEKNELEASAVLRKVCQKSGLTNQSRTSLRILLESGGVTRTIRPELMYWAHNFAPRGWGNAPHTDYGLLHVALDSTEYSYKVTSAAGILYIRTLSSAGSGVLALKRSVLLGETED